MNILQHAWRRFLCRHLGHRFDLKSRRYFHAVYDPCSLCSRCRYVSNGAFLFGLDFYEFEEESA